MKKLSMLIALVCVFAAAGFAEGDIHTGGRTCPPNQTCLHEPENPPPPPGESTAENSTDQESSGEETVYNQILVFLESIL